MGVDPQYALVSGLSVEDSVKGNSSYVTPLGVVVPPESLMKISGENPVEYGLETEIAVSGTTCDEHLWYKIDTVIYTGGLVGNDCAKQIWGIAKGDPANMLYGDGGRGTHINLGVSCTTGVAGADYEYCTVSGGYGNLAGYEGATVAGGQFNKVRGDNGFIGAGDSNRIEDASYSAIAGGYLNRIFATGDSCEGTRSLSLEDLEGDTTLGEGTIEGLRALYGGGEKYGYDFIGAGSENKICTGYNGIVAGSSNEISGYAGFIGSGMKNKVESAYGFIGAGYGNYASSSYASVVGGSSNSATGISAVICNGDQNKASSNYTFVGSGRMNEASGFASFVGGGFANKNLASYSFVGGGMSDSIKSLSLYGFIGAGRQNTVDGIASSIVGGGNNYVDGDYSVIGGGDSDTIKSQYSGIFSGYNNKIESSHGFIGGGANNHITPNAPYSTICGGDSNIVDNDTTPYGTICGGLGNVVNGEYTTICGGYHNKAGDGAAGDTAAFVGGGMYNRAVTEYSLVCGGRNNYAIGDYAAIISGDSNFVNNASHSVVVGGEGDTIQPWAQYSLAFGRHIVVANPYRVVFFDCTHSGRVAINRDEKPTCGGTLIYPLQIGTNSTNGNGAHLTSGGTWVNASSKEKKDSFVELNKKLVLKKIREMHIVGWHYKESEEYHIWPFAEDFYEAFGTGIGNEEEDRQYIAAGDMAGVALIAIQELSDEIDSLKSEISRLHKQIKSLESGNEK
ncbi:hypothetical protein J7K99_06485 [bacterium]|nr:hypothetical protein [bacterium]